MSLSDFLIIALTLFHFPPKKQILLASHISSELSTQAVKLIGPSSASIISITDILEDYLFNI